jgi:hypothetical protein
LLRGELLASLLDEDVQVLIGAIGLRTVVDLRSEVEVGHHRAAWEEHGVTWVHCPFALQLSGAVPRSGIDYAAAYMGYLDDDPAAVVLAARTALDPASRPVLFHCAAGKDRTGVLAAILLELLDVPRETIAEDYAATTLVLAEMLPALAALEPYRARLTGADPAQYAAVAEHMHAFLELLRRRHGGARAWLEAHGVPAAEIEAFRGAMLEPAATG